MKKMTMFLILASIFAGGVAFAEGVAKPVSLMMNDKAEGKVKVYQCSMEGYTADKPGVCPFCKMQLEEKEMTAKEAKAALEQSKQP